MPKKQTSFRLDSDMLKRLKLIALEKDKSLNSIILEALQDFLKKHKPKGE
jgi:predicted transcriptional regulator